MALPPVDCCKKQCCVSGSDSGSDQVIKENEKKKNKNHCRLVRKSILDKCRMYSDPALRLIFIRILFKHRVIKNTNPKSFGSGFNIVNEYVREMDPTEKIRSIGSK